MAETIIVSKDGQSFEIPNDADNLKIAQDKGYQPAGTPAPLDTTPLQESLQHPETQTQISQPNISSQVSDVDLTPDGKAKVFKDGNVFHIPADDENIKIARDKGYQLVSEVQAEQKQAQTDEAKINSYVEAFKPQYGAGSTFAGQYTHAYPTAGEEARLATQTRAQALRYANVPEKYTGILDANKVPDQDIPLAVEALNRLEGQHPAAKTAGQAFEFGANVIPSVAAGSLASQAAISAVPGLAAAKGITPSIGRALVGTLGVTAALNGPAAAREAIVDQNPEQAAEDLLHDYVFNLGMHAVGGLVGGVARAANKVQGAGLSDISAAAGAELPIEGFADPDGAKANYLEVHGATPAQVNDLTKGEGVDYNGWDKDKAIAAHDKYLGDTNDLNKHEFGRKVLNLQVESGKEIGAITKELDQLSKPESPVENPEGHQIQFPEKVIKDQFTNEYLQQEYNKLGKIAIPFETWKAADFNKENIDRLTNDGQKLFENIKANKLSLPDYIEKRQQDLFNIENKPLSFKSNPAEYETWKNTSEAAKATDQIATQDFKKVQEYSPEFKAQLKAVTATDNYTARADGNKILEQIKNFGTNVANIPEYQALMNKDYNIVKNNMDANGRISPTKMKEVVSHFGEQIKEDVGNTMNGIRKQMFKLVSAEKEEAVARIARAADKPDLEARLQEANDKYKLSKLYNDGKDFINSTGKMTPTGIRGVGPRAWTTFIARKLITPNWEQLGERKFARAKIKYINANNVTDHLVIEGNKKFNSILKQIPDMLIAANAPLRSKVRQEKRDFDGLKVLLGDKANGLSKSQQYKLVYDQLNDPAITDRQIQIGADLGDAKLSPIVTQKIAAMHALLRDAMAPTGQPVPFQKTSTIAPTLQQLNDLNDTVRLINNPAELVKDYQDGTLTPKKLAIVQSVFPASLAQMRQTIALESNKVHLDLQQRLFLSILMGSNLDSSLNNVAQLQSVSHLNPMPEAAINSGKVRHSGGKKADLPSNATESQRVVGHLR